jgi:hypothetical protein
VTDTRVNPSLFSRDPAERRAFRDRMSRGIEYFIPPELRPLLGFAAEMTPSAAVERGGAASMRAVQPDRTAMERLGDIGEVLSETAGVVAPAMVAGRAAMPAAQAAQEAFLGVSVPARAAADTVIERLNQPGPMPETLYSGFDPTAMLARRNAQESSFQYDLMVRNGVEPEIARQRVLRDYGVDPVSRTAAPSPREFGFTRDNPGGDWLQGKQENAERAMAESSRGLRRRGVTGSVTGTMGMETDMFLPTDRLSSLTGLMDERRRPGDLQFDALLARVREEGFDPNQAGNRIVIAVNHRGEPFVLEGNTRIAVARELGIPNVKAEVRYWNGGEMVDGPFAPGNVARIAARGPEGFAQGGPVTRPEPRPITLGAVPTGEMTRFGRPVFENPSSDRFSELTVTVPYGDRFVVAPSIYVEGGRPRVLSDAEVMEMLARHGPVDLMTNQELPTFSTIEEADAYARSRSDAMFGPEGFADGGEVFRGIGSLTSVARGMFGA